MSIPVGIVGFRGYSGMEVLRILVRHHRVIPVLLEHRSDVADRPVFRSFRPPRRIPCDAAAVRKEGLQVVFLATPAEVSMELAPAMLEAGAKVVDLSGAFRLQTPERHERWYHASHTQEHWLAQAAYGLPEFYRESIAEASLVANPGCYPTAANLAIRPLVEAGLIDRQHGIVCDAKSGVSGAGRKPSLKTSFCEVTENFSAYSVLDHRHVPEVLLHSHLEEKEFSFTAHLLPVHRGILETIYFRLARRASAEDLLAMFEKRYAGEPFLRFFPPGEMPDLSQAQFTNCCDIGVKADPDTGRAVVVSVIDNLGKGAAGQAIQNMNLLLGFPETEGLI